MRLLSPLSALTMMAPNCSVSARRPGTSTVNWKLWPDGVGGMPICPAATCWLCCLTALITSEGTRSRARSCSGSSQIRMLY